MDVDDDDNADVDGAGLGDGDIETKVRHACSRVALSHPIRLFLILITCGAPSSLIGG